MSGDGAATDNKPDDRLRVLILDDERIVGERLRAAYRKHGWDVAVYTDPTEARKRLTESQFDIVVTDIRMDEIDGMEVLGKVTADSPRTKVIIITGYASIETAVESARQGAIGYLPKPFTPDEIRTVTENALRLAA